MRPHDNPFLLAWEAFVMFSDNGRGRISWHAGRSVAFAAFTDVWPTRWQMCGCSAPTSSPTALFRCSAGCGKRPTREDGGLLFETRPQS
jgi:hypothetical protein